MTPQSDTLNPPSRRDLEFDLQRAQQAAYYAHRDAIQHPGQPEAQQNYREATRRCEAIIARIRETETRTRAEATN